MRCSFWLALPLSLGFTVLIQAGDPPGPKVPSRDDAVVYYWEPVAGSRKQELYASGHRIGVYDPETETYRRINTDGTLSNPCTPPWKQVTRTQAVEDSTEWVSGKTVKREAKKKAPKTEPKKEWVPREWEEDEGSWFPEWAWYAVTIGLTAVIGAFGIFLQVRRQ
jgi:hypothetical protein